jgi:hypothetical protein
MANFDPTGIVKSDLAELRRLMVALPTAMPGSAQEDLTVLLIRHLLNRVDNTIKKDRAYSGSELERKLIQDWFEILWKNLGPPGRIR